MTSDEAPEEAPEAPEVLDAPMPSAVRQRVVALAASALGAFAADEVPASLRAVARFTPTKRARSGASQLAAALEGDPVFRHRVAAATRVAQPVLAAALDSGERPHAVDPIELAAVAYLLRPPGWSALVQHAADAVAELARATTADAADAQVARLTAQLAALRAESRTAADRAREAVSRAEDGAVEARRRTRELEAELRRARATADEALVAAQSAAQEAVDAQAAAALETRRLRTRLADVEAALEATRRATREGRSAESVRLRLLLDTVVEAAHGLRRELALPPTTTRPADSVSGAGPQRPGAASVATRGLADDDPALLDQLLALPQVHLVVDGYNVTKTGYGSLSLLEQRGRLVTGLAALAARTRAEVTCVFDGTTLDVRVLSAPPRGVRVLFSAEGETADELIRRLVRAEPAGRPVVVVSSDREVADGVRQAGARPLPASVLVRRLDRP